jgi:DNA-binding NtrC family response regulator
VQLPSLSERRDDMPLLASELLERIGRSAGKHFSIDEPALRLLQDHEFPGNIRELRNILWQAAVSAPNGHIGVTQIAAALPLTTTDTDDALSPIPEEFAAPSLEPLNGGLSLRHVWDADNLAAVLERFQGNRRAAAQELGVSERTIYRKLRALGLN